MGSCLAREHKPIMYGDAMPAVPADDTMGSGSFHRSFDDRLWLFSRAWEPADKSKMWATLMIVHGTVDHSGVYDELARKLSASGVAVFAADMRGWGRSDGERLYFHDIEVFTKDVVEDYRRIHAPGSAYGAVRARFVMGKSLGGLITAWAASKHPELWTGLLGLSGAYRVDAAVRPTALQLLLLRVLGALCPKRPFRVVFNPKLIVSDEAALKAWERDPLVARGKAPLGYLLEIFSAIARLPKQAADLRLPVLMMWGTGDKVVTESGHKMIADLSGHESTQFKTYPGGFHNLLAEPRLKDGVMADIEAWLRKVAQADP